MKQPEALRLADAIKASGQFTNLATLDEAAAELRRLHEVNQELLEALKESEPMLAAMLENIKKYLGDNYKMSALDIVRAAITKAEGAA